MRNATKKKTTLGLSALAAAGMAAWAGAPAAHGAFTLSVYNSFPEYTNPTGYTTYVFGLQLTGADGTALEAVQSIIDAGTANAGAFAVDVENTSNKTGALARYTANIDGSQFDSNGGAATQNTTGISVYGDPEAGTFGGIGFDFNSTQGAAATFVPTDTTDNPFVTPGAGNTPKVYTNGQTQAYLPSGNTPSNYSAQTLANFDPAFKPINAIGNVNNGSLYSLQLDSIDSLGGTGNATPQSTVDGAIPFLQVVVKTGVVFTLNGLLSGSGTNGVESFSTIIGGSAVVTGPTLPTVSLTNSAPGSSNLIGSKFTISGSNGKYLLHNFPTTGTNNVNGYTDVTGFNPATDPEIYGLALDSGGTLASGTTLASIVADINTDLHSQDASWNAYALPPGSGTAAALLQAQGDNVEVVFPDVTDDAYFQYNFTGYTNGGAITVTQVSVVPEPTGIGALVLGGLGFVSRRRRSRKA